MNLRRGWKSVPSPGLPRPVSQPRISSSSSNNPKGRRQARLQAVRSDDFTRGQMLDEPMIAHFIERIGVAPRGGGLGQPFVQFEIEDGVAQLLRGAHVSGRPCEPRCVGRGAGQQACGFDQCLHGDECDNLFRCLAQRLFHPLAPLSGKDRRRMALTFIAVFMGGGAEKTNLLSVASAPGADKQVQAHPEALRQGRWLAVGFGLQPADLTATRQQQSHSGKFLFHCRLVGEVDGTLHARRAVRFVAPARPTCERDNRLSQTD